MWKEAFKQISPFNTAHVLQTKYNNNISVRSTEEIIS